ncbi:MAG: PA4780 family RIO1-like protein kinase [Myxococcota bacterium]
MPDSLVSLVEQGIIEDVVRPLMSGKEAQVYLVVAHGEQHVAKVYKEANDRTFKHRVEYTEGRRVRNSRDQRAMDKRSQYGRSQQEASWRTAEVDVIYRLRAAGVRVPEPKAYFDNVLVMELVTDRHGNPAPRLADVPLDAQQAEPMFDMLLREVVKMLCAGLVHGDLSEFNILAGHSGSVIIDFPQATDSATNGNARKFLIRDVGNLTRFFGRYRSELRSRRYAEEMWELYERGALTPDSKLTGHFKEPGKKAEVSSLLAEMEDIERENRARRAALGLPPVRPARQPRAEAAATTAPTKARRRRRPRRRSGGEQSP